MTALAIILATAAIAFGVARLLRIPPIPLLLACGIGLQFGAGVLEIELPEDMLQTAIELGLAVLVFAAGVDLSPRRVRGRIRPVMIIAVVQFSALGLAGMVAAYLLGYGTTTALYIGCALSASSTLVVVRHLQQRQQMFEPFGRLVIGVLLLQDVAILLLLVILSNLDQGWLAVGQGIAATAGLAVLAAALHRWGVPLATQRLNLDDEGLLVSAFALLFVFAGMAHVLGLPFVIGGFCAGFVLSAFPMNGLVRGMLGSLTGFFLALFFISIGAIITIPPLGMIGQGLLFTAVLLVVTVLLVTAIAEYVGLSTRASIETSLLLSQTSEFSLVLAMYGVTAGHISSDLFSMIVLITVGTMTLTPFIARDTVAWRLMHFHPRYRRGEGFLADLRDHVVVLGYGRSGPQVARTLEESGERMVVIDDDAAVIRRLINQHTPCVQGDGSDPKMLELCAARQAKLVLCSMRRISDAFNVLDYLRGSHATVLVRTFEPADAERVKQMGGLPILTSAAAAASLVEWLEVNHPVPENGGQRHDS